ncbi:MAG: tyrosine-type recombinase/integrase, partial [Nitrososphaeraceae archaeon]
NDYDDLKRRKIKRWLPKNESDFYARDRPYSVKEIDQILDKCDIRDRVAVLIMVSTGMRIGGLRELQIGHIKRMDEYGLYLIWVYNLSGEDRYYTFCSPECAAAIDEYLAYRARLGEQLKHKSPLIRDKFSKDNYFKAPRFLSIRAMSLLFEEALKKAGVNQVKPGSGQKKRDIMRSHGFRKFFITQCDKAGISFTVREYLSGHRLPNQDRFYIKPSEEDRLAEYVKAIPLLTINDKQRLEQENHDLKTVQAEDIAALKKKVDHVDAMMEALKGAITAKSQASWIGLKDALGWK